MKWPTHGSNPHYLYNAMNIPQPESFIDLSANINPLGSPPRLKEKWSSFFEKISDYPDPDSNSLKETIARRENVSKESILIGNGGAELITLVGRMLAGKNVLIVQPTFSEYEQACIANNCRVLYHQIDEDWNLNLPTLLEKLPEVEAVFLCNPNNPLGLCFPFETVQKLANACKANSSYLIVDEAFYDFWEDYQSLIPILKDYNNVILLRSMTKMFAIPGLRLGYALADENIIARLSRFQPHWSVNVVAKLAGEECLKDTTFVQETNNYIKKERQKLFSFFQTEGYRVSPSETNFYVLQDPKIEDQYPLFEYLLCRGVVPRHTMNFPGLEGKWLRFAIKSESENEQLMDFLRDWKS